MGFQEAPPGFEPGIEVLQTFALPLGYGAIFFFHDPCGIRTRVTAVKGRCLNRLTNGPYLKRPALLSFQNILLLNSPSGTRTCNPPVNSRMLCHWAIEDYFRTLKTEHKKPFCQSSSWLRQLLYWSSPRSISIGQLNMLPCLHLQPIYLVIFKGPYFRRMGNLILRPASRLDAFSVYPFHT